MNRGGRRGRSWRMGASWRRDRNGAGVAGTSVLQAHGTCQQRAVRGILTLPEQSVQAARVGSRAEPQHGGAEKRPER